MAEQKPQSLLDEIEQFDINDLELGEAADLEDAFGKRIEEIDWNTAKAMVHLIWIVRRRSDDSYTLEDAKRIKLSDFEVPNGNGKRPPTKPASKGRGKKRAAAGSQS